MPAVTRASILLVDDNPLNSKRTKFLLASNGYVVRTAGNAEQALEVLETFAPALILMDLQMPGPDGFELTRVLKRDPTMNDVVIVALTPHAMKGDRERALEAGCDGYIDTPLDTRDLPDLIAGYLTTRRETHRGGLDSSEG